MEILDSWGNCRDNIGVKNNINVWQQFLVYTLHVCRICQMLHSCLHLLSSQNQKIVWVGKDPEGSLSPALKWMASTGIKLMTLALLAPCFNQLISSQGCSSGRIKCLSFIFPNVRILQKRSQPILTYVSLFCKDEHGRRNLHGSFWLITSIFGLFGMLYMWLTISCEK